MNLGLSGLISGMDWHSVIDQLIQADRSPETRMKSDQDLLGRQNSAFGSIKAQLATLQKRLEALSDASLFDSRTSSCSDATVATAAVSASASLGTYSFKFTQLATAARQRGADDVGRSLSGSNDVSGLVLETAGFTSNITSGTFTINGEQITVDTADTLQAVFDRISSATGGAVDASYDSTTDRIKLNSANPIILGSATDTSNFLQATKLYNNGSGAVTSAAGLGGAKLNGSIASANLASAVSTGDGSTGEFSINGVSISYSVTADSIQDVLDRINNSSAGVTATYDSLNDRFVLTNRATGDVGIALKDVTGNFLAATGLSSGQLERGQNLVYSVNGGDPLISQSNTVTEASSGLTGLSVTAGTEGTVSVTVGSDTAKIKTAITDFLTEYNKTQSLIDSQTASSTDASGKVTSSVLAGDDTATSIASSLRSLSYTPVGGAVTSMKSLADLGIISNGNDNSLSLDDESKLDSALANHLGAVKRLFADAANGLAVQLHAFVSKTAGDDGTLATKQAGLIKQSASIDTQISDLERRLATERETLTAGFVAMETAQANINQQLQYLQQRFGSSS